MSSVGGESQDENGDEDEDVAAYNVSLATRNYFGGGIESDRLPHFRKFS